MTSTDRTRHERTAPAAGRKGPRARWRAGGAAPAPAARAAAALLATLGLLALAAGPQRTAAADEAYVRAPAPEGAELYFISPKDGETVKNPVTVRFGLRGMGVAPAGVDKPHTGHHHLLIDTEVPSYEKPLPSIPGKILHFGGGQTETTVELSPGRHTLQLVLGDRNHVPHDPPVVSKRIEITVEE